LLRNTPGNSENKVPQETAFPEGCFFLSPNNKTGKITQKKNLAEAEPKRGFMDMIPI
jgi:hypothetical protein